jgi:hypothetical protein
LVSGDTSEGLVETDCIKECLDGGIGNVYTWLTPFAKENGETGIVIQRSLIVLSGVFLND